MDADTFPWKLFGLNTDCPADRGGAKTAPLHKITPIPSLPPMQTPLTRATLLAAALFTFAARADAPAPLSPGEVPAADMARAKDILKQWEGDAPQKGERKLRLCYWTPADREPLPDRRERLTRVMQHIQAFYAKEMAGHGFDGRTLRLEMAADGLVELTDAKGSIKDAQCGENGPTGEAVRKDCLAALKAKGIDGNQETIVLFCNLTTWNPEKRTLSHHSPYFASGDAAHGTAWQVDSPLLDAALLDRKDGFIHDGQYGHVSLGKYNSIFVGGVAHELGHALGLPHCKECAGCRARLGHELMGEGNRTYGDELRAEGKGSFIGAPHALKLAAHPQFSGSVKDMAGRTQADFDGWRFTPRANGLEVTGRVSAKVPVHAVIAYADPEGGGDYDSEITAGVPQADGSFRLLLPDIEHKRNTTADLHFVAVCANGAATASVWSGQALTFRVPVDAKGRFDTSMLAATLAWDAVAKDWRAGKLPAKGAARAALPAATQELLRRLEAPDTAKNKPAPSAVAPGMEVIPLSDCAPATAKTGWRGAHFDRTHAGDALVSASGPARHGLWAHAPAEHTYDLGGQWGRLKGGCGPLREARDSAKLRFSIVADGKTVWSSGGKAGFHYDLDLTGVKTLVLHCEAADTGGAWGGWIEPLLTRPDQERK